MSVNVGGMFLFKRHQKENGTNILYIWSWGQIFIGSDYGAEINTPAVYSASKAAVVGSPNGYQFI